MKANLSQDTEFRTDVRVPFRLDRDQVATALALYTNLYEEDSVGDDLPEKEIMRRVRRQLMFKGLDGIDWADDEELSDDLKDWAKDQVSRFWKMVR